MIDLILRRDWPERQCQKMLQRSQARDEIEPASCERQPFGGRAQKLGRRQRRLADIERERGNIDAGGNRSQIRRRPQPQAHTTGDIQ